ncbi:MAG: hypothetical protein IPN32_39170 [Deltaproteobacteria bacterium]|nr:hypothetical protein [Deltaproteobacteria bacterium]
MHPEDEAWDLERVHAEQLAMSARDEDPRMHPVARYQGGWTRYDLDAAGTVDGRVATAREYLDEAKQPTMWKLRRLSWDQWYEVLPLWERAVRDGERPVKAYLRACVIGIEKVESGPTLDLAAGRLTTDDMARLHAIHPELPLVIGEAVYTANMPLTESEGKR